MQLPECFAGMKKIERKKSQAAITDAIILLLITTFSVGLMFGFVGNWGNDQDTVLRSGYVLNYMQSVVKAMYYVDVQPLQNIRSDGIAVYTSALKADGSLASNAEYNLDDSQFGCAILKDYPGTLRVTDLLKRDLGEADASQGQLPKFDDKFGTAAVPGRTAMRCALKELMKPFAFSGYKYYLEVLNLENPSDPEGDPIPIVGPEITNSKNPKIVGILGTNPKKTADGNTPGCKAALDLRQFNVITVSSPFQVLYSETTGDQLKSTFLKFKTRVCIWPAKEN